MAYPRQSLLVALTAFLSVLLPGNSLAHAQEIRWARLTRDLDQNPDVGVEMIWGTYTGRSVKLVVMKRAEIANARFVGTSGEVSLREQVLDQQDRILTLPVAQLNQSPGWVALELQPSLKVLSTPRWRAFLGEEGKPDPLHLDSTAPDRAIRVRSHRYYKVMVHRGNSARSAAFTKPVGQTLEIVLLADPMALSSNAVPVQVIFNGKPLAGVRVNAAANSAPDAAAAVTDGEGKALLMMTSLGSWVLWVKHLIQASGEAEVEVYSATLTLRRA